MEAQRRKMLPCTKASSPSAGQESQCREGLDARERPWLSFATYRFAMLTLSPMVAGAAVPVKGCSSLACYACLNMTNETRKLECCTVPRSDAAEDCMDAGVRTKQEPESGTLLEMAWRGMEPSWDGFIWT